MQPDLPQHPRKSDNPHREHEDRGTVSDLVNNELKLAHITEADVSRLVRMRPFQTDNPRLILIQLISPQLK